ncbi:MAG TPA: GNAT family N-acetyltransferase [Lysobacter sp.]
MPAAVSSIRVARVQDAAVVHDVQALRVADDQYCYVGDTAFNVDDSLRDPMSEAMAVFAAKTVVGFYRLDFSPGSVAAHELPEPGVGLRAFVIDHAHQGRGYGAAALVAAFADLRKRHPQRRLLALTVNCANHAAIALYLKAGFVDTGEIYLGGSSGPQHFMLYRLQPRPPL